MIKILIIILLVFMFFCIYMLIRNQLVYRMRIKILYKNMELYRKLPSYHEMMYCFKPIRLSSFLTKEEIESL